MNELIDFPRAIDVTITGRCNLRCKYCFHHDSKGEVKEDLPKEAWLSFFSKLESFGVLKIYLSGGEPFIRKDICDIIEGIVNHQMYFAALSNGAFLTKNVCHFLAMTKRCDNIQLSLDSESADIHDDCRGKGSFSKAIQAIENLKNENIPVGVRITITKRNLCSLEKTAEFLLEKLDLPYVSTNQASDLGLCHTFKDDLLLTSHEQSEAMKIFVRLKSKYQERIFGTSGPLFHLETWQKMERARKEKAAPFPNGGYLTACACIFRFLAVRADGVLIPCNLLSHIELGHIFLESDLKEVWQTHPDLIKLRKRKKISLASFKKCQGCDYIPYCTGNCPAIAFSESGFIDHPNQESCLRKFLEEGGELPGEIVSCNTH